MKVGTSILPPPVHLTKCAEYIVNAIVYTIEKIWNFIIISRHSLFGPYPLKDAIVAPTK